MFEVLNYSNIAIYLLYCKCSNGVWSVRDSCLLVRYFFMIFASCIIFFFFFLDKASYIILNSLVNNHLKFLKESSFITTPTPLV